MRVLLINNHDLSDPTAGVTQSLRTLLRWLNEAGHPTHALTTTRVDGRDVALRSHVSDATTLVTTHHDEARPDETETAQYLARYRHLLAWHRPDLVLACNGHPMIFQALAEARRSGLTTVLAVRGYGYNDPRLFADVDAVWTCSPYLSEYYRAAIGLNSTPLPPPMAWDEIVAGDDGRTHLTFVNPSLQKGVCLMLRLVEELATRQPDIPILVIQSGQPPVPWRHPNLTTLTYAARPADWLTKTKLLLVPSAWDEPFGRVSAEAMLNGIPAIVSDRGALPSIGAIDVPLPSWMTWQTHRLPTAVEVQPWVDVTCRLWDDSTAYTREAVRVGRLARNRYSEAVVKPQHLAYFTTLPVTADIKTRPRGHD